MLKPIVSDIRNTTRSVDPVTNSTPALIRRFWISIAVVVVVLASLYLLLRHLGAAQLWWPLLLVILLVAHPIIDIPLERCSAASARFRFWYRVAAVSFLAGAIGYYFLTVHR
jgi:hypothetical protein